MKTVKNRPIDRDRLYAVLHGAKQGQTGRDARDRQLTKDVERLEAELLMVSLLAADTPQFYNPLHVIKAKEIRDRVLLAAERAAES